MKESGAHAVKLEGGEFIIESVKRILSAGIPVMGHLGLTPQSIYKFGTYVVRATSDDEAEQLVRDAKLLQDAGCFAIVLEKIPAQLAERVAKQLAIPTIGHRGRPRRRRAGARHARHARYQPGILTPVSPPLRASPRCREKRVRKLYRRREVGIFPERRRELLTRGAVAVRPTSDRRRSWSDARRGRRQTDFGSAEVVVEVVLVRVTPGALEG